MKTDIVGASRAGLDALLVTQGIHRLALHNETPASRADPMGLQRLYDEYGAWPVAAMSVLRP
jgi:ribonucleotide monophosphatase NagD (HAD superfamily)